MAHFAKLGTGNIITAIHTVNNNELLDENGVEQEAKGVAFLNTLFRTNDIWKQTSYNTRFGVHILGGTPFRKTYAGIGYTYRKDIDGFVPPSPYASWILDEATCDWGAPVAKPETFTQNLKDLDGSDAPDKYYWNEAALKWILIT